MGELKSTKKDNNSVIDDFLFSFGKYIFQYILLLITVMGGFYVYGKIIGRTFDLTTLIKFTFTNQYNVLLISSILFFIYFMFSVIDSEDNQREDIKKLPERFNFTYGNHEDNYYLSVKQEKNGDIILTTPKGAVDFNMVLNKKENLEQYLGYEIEIERHGQKGIRIFKNQLPTEVRMNVDKLKDGEIYLGEGENGSVYIPLVSKSFGIGGESGAGKSSAMNTIMVSVIKNLRNNLSSFYLVDLKDGGIEAEGWRWIEEYFPNFKVITNEKDLLDVLLELQQIVITRNTIMKKEKSKNYPSSGFKPIYLYIDEYSRVNEIDMTRYKSDKEYKETKDKLKQMMVINTKLWRASGVVNFLSTQIFSVENVESGVRGNIQNKMLMKSSSQLNGSLLLKPEVYETKYPSLSCVQFKSGETIMHVEDEVVHFQGCYTTEEDIKEIETYYEQNEKTLEEIEEEEQSDDEVFDYREEIENTIISYGKCIEIFEKMTKYKFKMKDYNFDDIEPLIELYRRSQFKLSSSDGEVIMELMGKYSDYVTKYETQLEEIKTEYENRKKGSLKVSQETESVKEDVEVKEKEKTSQNEDIERLRKDLYLKTKEIKDDKEKKKIRDELREIKRMTDNHLERELDIVDTLYSIEERMKVIC